MFDVDAAIASARRAVETATACGATQADAGISITDRFSCEARASTLTKLEQSTSRSMRVRVFVDGRKSSLITSDFSQDALRAAIERAVSQARCVARDPFSSLPDPHDCFDGMPDLQLYSPDVRERTSEQKIAEALEIEDRIRRLDDRIDNSNGSHVGDACTVHVLVNSNDFCGQYRSTRAHRSTSPVGADNGKKRTASYATAARRIAEMEPAEAVAAKAVQRAVGLFGARKPATARVPVIFERDVAAAVLGDILAAVAASNVAIGNSWLAQRIGETIGSENVTIIDDGTMPGKLGSSPFDGEGVATRRTVVVDRGKLQSFLFDSYYARKLGSKSTGNSNGSGIGPNNFYLERGSGTLDDLVARTARGVLVTDTIGFATEYASGTYSRGARGYWIDGGAIAYPVEEFTIASTFERMLTAIDAVADDAIFDGSVVSPSFRVAEMTVSGE